MKTDTIDRIKALRSEAANFAGFHAMYSEKYATDSSCDKKGYGFGTDDRFTAFDIKVNFASWAGYYGNSSCGTIMSVYHKDLVRPFLVKALNVHQKEIFATVGRLMREEAATLTGKAEEEIIALQKMLTEASSVLSPVSEAA